ncbi:hypothetical protein AERO_01910 [Aeromicrobium fastidiosum]|uniref:hypothetical protein n=1 Tax=Aeromicrobium fastidiosum TaxID=52699 RepID=UPI00202360F7|nr:hypothetical protein [Aeromicrobium fastidiosum]MCL8250125.1 hypothetical protein [Aeromicrobium fastidiosum]
MRTTRDEVRIRVGWNNLFERFLVTGDDGAAALPRVSQRLLDDLAAWQDHLLENFTPEDSVRAGTWRENTRWWFVAEARRLENEFRRQLDGRAHVVRLSPYPGTIPIQIYADYSDWPLWDVEGGTGPEDFPTLSDQLRDDLVSWALATEVGSPSDQVGTQLVARLRAELGHEFDVTF